MGTGAGIVPPLPERVLPFFPPPRLLPGAVVPAPLLPFPFGLVFGPVPEVVVPGFLRRIPDGPVVPRGDFLVPLLGPVPVPLPVPVPFELVVPGVVFPPEPVPFPGLLVPGPVPLPVPVPEPGPRFFPRPPDEPPAPAPVLPGPRLRFVVEPPPPEEPDPPPGLRFFLPPPEPLLFGPLPPPEPPEPPDPPDDPGPRFFLRFTPPPCDVRLSGVIPELFLFGEVVRPPPPEPVPGPRPRPPPPPPEPLGDRVVDPPRPRPPEPLYGPLPPRPDLPGPEPPERPPSPPGPRWRVLRPYSWLGCTCFFEPPPEEPSLAVLAVFATASRCSRFARPAATAEWMPRMAARDTARIAARDSDPRRGAAGCAPSERKVAGTIVPAVAGAAAGAAAGSKSAVNGAPRPGSARVAMTPIGSVRVAGANASGVAGEASAGAANGTSAGAEAGGSAGGSAGAV
ncbi:hypothetical protein (plasmid) [Streptomyces leeuwenhoekii]|uniref:Uncharacterized protein n=1 Tax=Streptomyces leeuwenhoekii TaxID=1437453 RepID=A0A0F7VKN1_STRLW|nr:hypothetical protein [Streptomyces leeuwenhoekii]